MMFRLTGVTKPELDVPAVTSRGDDYAGLASAAQTTKTTIGTAIANVTAQNEGSAVGRFKTAAGRVADQFAALADAAGRTAAAYRSAGAAGGGAQLAMIGLNAQATNDYWTGLANGATPHELGLLVQVTRTSMLQLETDAVTKINQAFEGLDLPGELPISRADENGRLDTRIADKWSSLDDDQRMRVLQNMADAYADAHGYPRIKITFESIKSDPGTIVWGKYNDSSGRLRLNKDQLADPTMINTVAHEMEHRGQYQGMGSRWPWQDERAGMTRAEAERWRQLNAEHVRERGGGSPGDMANYLPRPVEVHAREAGREFVNTMSYEDFLGYL